VNLPTPWPDAPGQIAGRPLEEWNAAYLKVESYFHALRLRNNVLLGELVLSVLNRAMDRAPKEPEHSATEIAADEMDRLLAHWFRDVLKEPTGSAQILSTRGRLALYLADMPTRWQAQFLRPGPWPEEFVKAMRTSYMDAGPDFQLARMSPRPLDLGPIGTLTNLARLPVWRMFTIWFLFALVLIAYFIHTYWRGHE
jgi:hypothetical protein